MKTIKREVECVACDGTGLYQGIGEINGAACICTKCKGSGCFLYSYSYKNFTKRKIKKNIKRVYLTGTGYVLSPGKVTFEDVGTIDMDKEGISYSEFLKRETPYPIKKLVCPMLADQERCHKIKGFVEECNSMNGGWVSIIKNCIQYENKEQCWNRLNELDKGD